MLRLIVDVFLRRLGSKRVENLGWEELLSCCCRWWRVDPLVRRLGDSFRCMIVFDLFLCTFSVLRRGSLVLVCSFMVPSWYGSRGSRVPLVFDMASVDVVGWGARLVDVIVPCFRRLPLDAFMDCDGTCCYDRREVVNVRCAACT